jgi:hypothetical protein
MRAAYDEPAAPSSAPLAVLREHLEDARARGEGFGSAWPGAVKVALEAAKPAHRREWRACLETTRSTWKRCFDRELHAPRRRLVNARTLLDREPLPDRWCEQCGGSFGTTAVGDKFCSTGCSHAASAVISVEGFGSRRGPMRQPELPLAA